MMRHCCIANSFSSSMVLASVSPFSVFSNSFSSTLSVFAFASFLRSCTNSYSRWKEMPSEMWVERGDDAKISRKVGLAAYLVTEFEKLTACPYSSCSNDEMSYGIFEEVENRGSVVTKKMLKGSSVNPL